MRLIMLLSVAGAAGAVSRYYVGQWAHASLGRHFAFGTLIVNILGCFLIGLLMEIGLSQEGISREMRDACTIGFLGAFTTFSAFGYDTVGYMQEGDWQKALGNVGANVIFGLFAAWAGILTSGSLISNFRQ